MRYGSSPDTLGTLGILSDGGLSPIESSDTFPQYFVQCQLQMLCSDAEFCIMQSYHTETKTSILLLLNTIILQQQ